MLAFQLTEEGRAFDRDRLEQGFWPLLPADRACEALNTELAKHESQVSSGSSTSPVNVSSKKFIAYQRPGSHG